MEIFSIAGVQWQKQEMQKWDERDRRIFGEGKNQLLELWNYDSDVDLLPYTPREFEKKKEEIGIVREAVKGGIEV